MQAFHTAAKEKQDFLLTRKKKQELPGKQSGGIASESFRIFEMARFRLNPFYFLYFLLH